MRSLVVLDDPQFRRGDSHRNLATSTFGETLALVVQQFGDRNSRNTSWIAGTLSVLQTSG
ncbi:MAG TPA: hypothetical protein VGP10_00095 [Marisediminicola sp.]|nr:hypothetical protein [Marisediminicola sp.]